MFKCPLCENQYEKMLSLSLHYRKGHKGKTAKDLYVDFYLSGVEPTCKCGCGETVKFLDITRGFSEYVWGHAARVSNNFQTEKAKSNSLKTRRKMLEDGTWKPFTSNETGEHWNKGLTKETDERVARQIEERDTPEYKAIASARMKENRLKGIIPTLSGPAHSQWKGGISPLNVYCRSSMALYNGWKYPNLVRAKFMCEECSKSGPSLEVHHDKESFSEILRKVAKQHKWEDLLSSYLKPDEPQTQQLKEQISEAVANYHIQNNISGIVLCEKCHKKRHNDI